jgi:hypothetical protein
MAEGFLGDKNMTGESFTYGPGKWAGFNVVRVPFRCSSPVLH